MHADPVYGSAELVHPRRTNQIRVAYSPRLVRVVQRALRGGEKIVRRERVRRRPEEVSANIPPEEGVLAAGLVIAAGDILILIDLRKQTKTRVAARGAGRRQERRQFEGRRVQK